MLVPKPVDVMRTQEESDSSSLFAQRTHLHNTHMVAHIRLYDSRTI